MDGGGVGRSRHHGALNFFDHIGCMFGCAAPFHPQHMAAPVDHHIHHTHRLEQGRQPTGVNPVRVLFVNVACGVFAKLSFAARFGHMGGFRLRSWRGRWRHGYRLGGRCMHHRCGGWFSLGRGHGHRGFAHAASQHHGQDRPNQMRACETKVVGENVHGCLNPGVWTGAAFTRQNQHMRHTVRLFWPLWHKGKPGETFVFIV